MLAKVPLHPLFRIFSLLEVISRLLFSLLESTKIIFFFTSCQPNWSLVSVLVFGDEEMRLQIPLLTVNDLRTHPRILHDDVYMKPTANCGVIPILTITFVAAAMVFFFLGSILRFYIIVARPANSQQETLAKPSQVIALSLMGLLACLLCIGWRWSIYKPETTPFTMACEAPDIKAIPISPHAPMPFNGLMLYTITIILSITIVYKVKKSSTASSDSRHTKLAVNSFSHVVSFAIIALLSLESNFSFNPFNSTNMTRVSMNIFDK